MQHVNDALRLRDQFKAEEEGDLPEIQPKVWLEEGYAKAVSKYTRGKPSSERINQIIWFFNENRQRWERVETSFSEWVGDTKITEHAVSRYNVWVMIETKIDFEPSWEMYWVPPMRRF